MQNPAKYYQCQICSRTIRRVWRLILAEEEKLVCIKCKLIAVEKMGATEREFIPQVVDFVPSFSTVIPLEQHVYDGN